MDEVMVPVYLITGFLESGKTRFIDNTVKQEYFQIPGVTLVVTTEEGIEEHSPEELRAHRTLNIDIESKEELTEARMQELEDTFHPERVLIEYNPLWGMADIENMDLPEGWGLIQQIVIVDASTYEVYRNNMRSLFADMFRNADMVIFNRCTEDMPLVDYRRGIKVVNQSCEIVFENTEGRIMDIFMDSMPYDMDADVIEVEDADFGIFFVDLRDNPEMYDGKKVHFRGKVEKRRMMPPKYFGIGWMAMTCCADDIQFIGYLAESKDAPSYESGSWVEIWADIEIRHMMAYRGKGPVFKVYEMKAAEAPKSELVYFN
ncbi:MAG: GTP-binding protein [Lachnospiraceae bacterium]|nr:GTP-binding protein [Lachnospiraceae bacterium]